AIARHHTLAASPAFFEWNACKINVIDTPGSGNFLSDARAALRVADAAVVVVDAVSGVEVSTEKAWEAAEHLHLPRLIVCNHMDRDRASFDRALESIRGAFGRSCHPVQLPIGEEKTFRGVIDLRSMKACLFAEDGSGRMTEAEVPADLREAAAAARESLIELVAESDEALMERFFEHGTLEAAELESGLRRAVQAGRIAPVFCASALHNVGAQPLADAIVSLAPSPSDRGFHGGRVDGADLVVPADDGAPLRVYAWKTIADQFA